MCSPSPPPAPDYGAAAREQGVANVEAARTQGRINNPNVRGPSGSQTVTWEGDTPTVTQTLSPLEQDIYELGAYNRRGLGGLANQGINSLVGLIGRNLDFSGVGELGDIYSGDAGSMRALDMGSLPDQMDVLDMGSLPGQATAYRGAQGLPDMPEASGAIRDRVIEAMMSRANEDFGARQEEENANLIARGIRPGTEAYTREQDALNRARNDFRLQAEIAGGTAADQAFGQDLSRRQQGYNEATTDATLGFSQQSALRDQIAREQAQMASQQAARRGQATQEQAQQFNQMGQRSQLIQSQQAQRNAQQNERRRQQIAELLAQRQTPLNEIIGLMSGSQVSNPFSMPGYAQNTNVAPAPIFGAAQATGNQANNIYNAQVGTSNSNTQAAGALGAAAIAAFF